MLGNDGAGDAQQHQRVEVVRLSKKPGRGRKVVAGKVATPSRRRLMPPPPPVTRTAKLGIKKMARPTVTAAALMDGIEAAAEGTGNAAAAAVVMGSNNRFTRLGDLLWADPHHQREFCGDRGAFDAWLDNARGRVQRQVRT